MKISEVAKIEDPVERLRRAGQMLEKLREQENLLMYIRDDALVTLRDMTVKHRFLAEILGVSESRTRAMESRARERVESIQPPWEGEDGA